MDPHQLADGLLGKSAHPKSEEYNQIYQIKSLSDENNVFAFHRKQTGFQEKPLRENSFELIEPSGVQLV